MSNTATFNTSPNLKLSKKLSFGEEVANSVTQACFKDFLKFTSYPPLNPILIVI